MGNRHPIPPLVEGTRCVPIFIPDSVEYSQLLIFAVRKMCQQSYYERDGEKSAKIIADVLKEVTLQPLIEAMATSELCGESMPIDCGEVEDCLETSTIINSIDNKVVNISKFYNQFNMGENEYLTDRTTQETLEIPYENLPPPPAGQICNRDALWAGCFAVVEYLDSITIDLLEVLTSANDQNERYASWVEAIPFISTLPLDEALEYTAYMSQELENSYNASVTLGFKQEIACELFCKLAENCDSLSNSNLLDYLFGDRLGFDYATITQLTAFTAILGLPFNEILVGEDMALSMWATAVWLASAQAQYYGGNGDKGVNIAFRTGINSPDNDWTILCDECPDDFWEQVWDFSVSDHGFVARDGLGAYASGEWQSIFTTGVGERITLDKVFGFPVEFTEYEVHYHLNDGNLQIREFGLKDYTTGTYPVIATLANSAGTHITENENVEGWSNVGTITVALHKATPTASTLFAVTKIVLRGVGNNPF